MGDRPEPRSPGAAACSGLLVDRDFGLAAWQPLWLRGRARASPRCSCGDRRAGCSLAAPLAAGWAMATWVAVTMHGWWFPGRHVAARPAVRGAGDRVVARPPRRRPRRGVGRRRRRRRVERVAGRGRRPSATSRSCSTRGRRPSPVLAAMQPLLPDMRGRRGRRSASRYVVVVRRACSALAARRRPPRTPRRRRRSPASPRRRGRGTPAR